MNDELILDRFGIKQRDNSKESVKLFKKICNDSLFYFGIFLAAFFVLNLIPFLSGVISNINFGINEVIVSFLGFGNVFFMFLINKLFHKKRYND